MSAPPEYQPAWLQPPEALWLCMKAGIESETATGCLARVWHDQGCRPIAWDDVADPARDLLRFDPAMKQHPYFGLCHKAGVDPLSARRMLTLWLDRGGVLPAVPESRPPLKGHGEIDWLRFLQFCKIPMFRRPTDADIASDLVLEEFDDNKIQAVDLSYIEFMPFEVSRQQLVALLPKEKSKAGRKSTVDWDAVQCALENQIKQRGMFGPDNGTGWQSQADVERFVADLLSGRGEKAAEATIREHVKEMLKVIKAGN